MYNSSKILRDQYFSWDLLYYLLAGLMLMAVLYSCKDNTISVESTKPSGTITGVVVDKSTSEPLANVEVTLAYANPDSTAEEKFTRVTDKSGRFIFADIPVNNNGNKFGFDIGLEGEDSEDVEFSAGSSANYSYSLTLDMSRLEGYRSYMIFDDIRLNFDTAGGLAGGGAVAQDLVSSVVLPVGKLNASVKGKVVMNTTSEAVEGAKVEVYLADGYEGFDSASDILINSGTTDAAGMFKLDSLDESSEIYLRITKDIDNNRRINEKTEEYDLLASAQGERPVLDVGDIRVTPVNSASEFYITDVSMADGSLVNDPSDVGFSFTFNKPVKQTPYTSTAHSFGVNSGTIIDDLSLTETGTRAKIGAEYELSVTWNDNFDQLSVEVTERLPDGYTFTFDATAALSKLTDGDDASLYFGADAPYSSLGDAGTIDFATNGNTSAPATPQLVAVYNEEVDYAGAAVELRSIVDESNVEVAYVEIYKKVGNENFTRIETVDDWFADQIRYFSNTGLLVKSRSGGINYDHSVEVSYKVRAVSVNLKRSDFSDTVTLKDVMGPRVVSADYTTLGAPAGKAYLYVEFSEPMRFFTTGSELLNASNYSFRDLNDETKVVTDVKAEIYYFDDYMVRLEIPENAVVLSSDKILVDPAVTDLAGNGVSQDGTDDEAVIH